MAWRGVVLFFGVLCIKRKIVDCCAKRYNVVSCSAFKKQQDTMATKGRWEQTRNGGDALSDYRTSSLMSCEIELGTNEFKSRNSFRQCHTLKGLQLFSHQSLSKP